MFIICQQFDGRETDFQFLIVLEFAGLLIGYESYLEQLIKKKKIRRCVIQQTIMGFCCWSAGYLNEMFRFSLKSPNMNVSVFLRVGVSRKTCYIYFLF